MKSEEKSKFSGFTGITKDSNGKAKIGQLVEVIPRHRFELTKKDKEGLTGSFKIRNLNGGHVMFKVRTNAVNIFQAYPVFGFLDLDRSTVSVLVKEKATTSLSLDEEVRFQVQACKIPVEYCCKISSTESLTQLGQFWKELTSKMDVVSAEFGVSLKLDADDADSSSFETTIAISDGENLSREDLAGSSSTDLQCLNGKVATLKRNVEFKDKLIEKLKDELRKTRTTDQSMTSKNIDANIGGKGEEAGEVKNKLETMHLKETCMSAVPGNVDKKTCCNDITRSEKNSVKDDKHEIVPAVTFPARFAILRSKHRLQMIAVSKSICKFYGCFNCRVDFEQPDASVCLTLFCNPMQQYALQVCFEKQSRESKFQIGSCFFQVRFLNVNHEPVSSHSFQFDAKQGTCELTSQQHASSSSIHMPTFTSDPLIHWNELQAGKCFVKGINYFRNMSTTSCEFYDYINVDVEIVFMRNATETSLCKKAAFPSTFATKLTNLLHASSEPGPCFNRRVLVKCGPESKESFIFFWQLLAEYSPVVELLGFEIDIAKDTRPVEIQAPYLTRKAMLLFYEYVHGRDDGIWEEDATLNIQLLAFAISLFMPDLAQICVRNLSTICDRRCQLEDALAMIQTGRKLNLKCLEDRGIRWIELDQKSDQYYKEIDFAFLYSPLTHLDVYQEENRVSTLRSSILCLLLDDADQQCSFEFIRTGFRYYTRDLLKQFFRMDCINL